MKAAAEQHQAQNTHDRIDPRLVGTPARIVEGEAEVQLTTVPEMAADERGLVHGGFIFGLADYAAMLAINHPNVVLGGAEMRFLKPVVVGDALVASARRRPVEGKKLMVDAEVKRDGVVVFTGVFTCFTPKRHVLENSPG